MQSHYHGLCIIFPSTFRQSCIPLACLIAAVREGAPSLNRLQQPGISPPRGAANLQCSHVYESGPAFLTLGWPSLRLLLLSRCQASVGALIPDVSERVWHVPFCEPVQQVCAVLTSFRAMIPQAPWADLRFVQEGKGGVVGRGY